MACLKQYQVQYNNRITDTSIRNNLTMSILMNIIKSI
jgi:hypothetical protein